MSMREHESLHTPWGDEHLAHYGRGGVLSQQLLTSGGDPAWYTVEWVLWCRRDDVLWRRLPVHNANYYWHDWQRVDPRDVGGGIPSTQGQWRCVVTHQDVLTEALRIARKLARILDERL